MKSRVSSGADELVEAGGEGGGGGSEMSVRSINCPGSGGEGTTPMDEKKEVVGPAIPETMGGTLEDEVREEDRESARCVCDIGRT